jgi:molecular chaperone DnaK (HSP70)
LGKRNENFTLFIVKPFVMKEKNLRIFIREMIQEEIELKEFDAILSKKAEWKEEAKTLRSNLTDLLKNIENDEYEDGLKTIDDVTEKLKNWKTKINKFL